MCYQENLVKSNYGIVQHKTSGILPICATKASGVLPNCATKTSGILPNFGM